MTSFFGLHCEESLAHWNFQGNCLVLEWSYLLVRTNCQAIVLIEGTQYHYLVVREVIKLSHASCEAQSTWCRVKLHVQRRNSPVRR